MDHADDFGCIHGAADEEAGLEDADPVAGVEAGEERERERRDRLLVDAVLRMFDDSP